jgi:23S rRNA-/tRNA-specific pseudouridylate synthase
MKGWRLSLGTGTTRQAGSFIWHKGAYTACYGSLELKEAKKKLHIMCMIWILNIAIVMMMLSAQDVVAWKTSGGTTRSRSMLQSRRGVFAAMPRSQASKLQSGPVSTEIACGRQEFVVSCAAPLRLDAFLCSVLPDFSRSYFAKVCDEETVLVNEKPRRKAFQVKADDVVSILLSNTSGAHLSPFGSDVTPTPIKLDILFEDDDIIVVNKPAGMVVHPAPGVTTSTFANALVYHLGANSTLNFKEDAVLYDGSEVQAESDDDKKGIIDHDNDVVLPTQRAKYPVPRNRIGIVHRLDKGTTGVLLAGKNLFSTYHLSEQFMNRQVRKTYIAICFGNPKIQTVDTYIRNDPENHKLMQATRDETIGARRAVSHVKTIAYNRKFSICAVRIETGRYVINSVINDCFPHS